MILVLAGTSEGRKAAVALEREGKRVLASTATAYGKELLQQGFKGEISARPLTLEDMLSMIDENKITSIVDATHPFAVEVSDNAQEACRRAGIKYRRIERESVEAKEGGGVIIAGDVDGAVQLAAAANGNIFLTVGSSRLEQYTAFLDRSRLVVRILPVKKSLNKCLDLGISPGNIIAMQGPFDQKLNRLLFERYRACLVITKESGPDGGTAEKIRAARELFIPIIVIARPLKS